MSKTGKINYRRGGKGTPKSVRRVLEGCVRQPDSESDPRCEHLPDYYPPAQSPRRKR